MLSKRETLVLKGLAILAIVLHNIMHKFTPVYGENEFYFSPVTFSNYLCSFTNAPEHFFQYFFSYFGHYGVQLFIFLSGYGLTISYSNKRSSFLSFIGKRLIKIYPVFLIAVTLVIVLKYVVLNNPFDFNTATDILYNITLISNWIPEKWYTLSGPFWFYSMIVQLYVLFYLLVKWTKNNIKLLWLIFILSYVFIFMMGSYFESIKLSLYLNFMGNLPVFVLGMILAKTKFDFNKTPTVIWFLLLFVFILGQFYRYVWYVSQVSVVMLFIPFFIKIKKHFKYEALSNFLLYTGKLSMYLFAVNGVLRAPWLYLIKGTESRWYPYLFTIAHLLFVFVVALTIREVEGYIMSRLYKRRS